MVKRSNCKYVEQLLNSIDVTVYHISGIKCEGIDISKNCG